MIFFVLILELQFQRYLTTTKKSPGKKFLETLSFCSSRQNHIKPNSLDNCGFGGKDKTHSFQKLFLADIVLYLLNIFATAAPKCKTKHVKNYSSILAIAIVNHRNWVDDSLPLRSTTVPNFIKIEGIWCNPFAHLA